MMRQSKSIEKRDDQAITTKTKLLHDLETIEELSFNYKAYYKNPLVTIDYLSIPYLHHLNDFQLVVNQTDKILLTGSNGTVKPKIMKAIINQRPGIVLPGNLKISCIPQNF